MKKLLPLALAAFVTASAFSQPVNQPWTAPLPAWDSNVRSCSAPVPLPRIAADDFKVNVTTTYTRLIWWGNLLNPSTTQKQFYVAIYLDNGLCQPNFGALVYRACLIPQYTAVGTDCNGRIVYRFQAPLAPVVTLAPNHYWISIAETLSTSPTAAPDFWWSVHQPVTNCPAVQYDGVTIFQPLFNPCSTVGPDDLAYLLL